MPTNTDSRNMPNIASYSKSSCDGSPSQITKKTTPVRSPTLTAHPAHLAETSCSPREEVVEDIIRPVKRHSNNSCSIPVNFHLTKLEFKEDSSCDLKENDDWQENHSVHDARPSSQTNEKQYYSSLDEISDTHRDVSIQTLPLDSISEMEIPSPPTYSTAQNMSPTDAGRPPEANPMVVDSMPHIVQSQESFHTSYQPLQSSNTMETPLLSLPSYSQQGPHAQLEMIPAKSLNSRPAVSSVDSYPHQVVQLNHPGIPFVPSVPVVETSVPPTTSHYALTPAPYPHAVEELTGQLTVPHDDIHVWVDSQNRIFLPAAQPVSQHFQLQSEPDFSVPPFPGYKAHANADPSVPQLRRKVIPGRIYGTSDSGIGSNSSSRGLCSIFTLNILIILLCGYLFYLSAFRF